MKKTNGLARKKLRTKIACVLFAACVLTPATAYAAPTEGGASGFLGLISGFFSNLNGLGFVIYEGCVALAGIITFLSMGKELIPALLRSNPEERVKFKAHLSAAVTAAVVLLAFALAPLYVPALLSYFGATGDMGLGTVVGS